MFASCIFDDHMQSECLTLIDVLALNKSHVRNKFINEMNMCLLVVQWHTQSCPVKTTDRKCNFTTSSSASAVF